MKAYNIRPNGFFKLVGTDTILRRVDCFFTDRRPTVVRQGTCFDGWNHYILAISEKEPKPDAVFFIPLVEEVECL